MIVLFLPLVIERKKWHKNSHSDGTADEMDKLWQLNLSFPLISLLIIIMFNSIKTSLMSICFSLSDIF